MSRRLAAHAAVVIAAAFCLGSAVARAEDWPDPDTIRLISLDRAAAHGVDPAAMLRVADCESRFRPSARGDVGRSHGLYQFNDEPTGLLSDFYRRGYTDPYDAEQASDYFARVLAGEWADEGITRWRWSCR
jgi:hypothetical protein